MGQNPGTLLFTQNSWDLWMFIPLKMVSIGIDPYPCKMMWLSKFWFSSPQMSLAHLQLGISGPGLRRSSRCIAQKMAPNDTVMVLDPLEGSRSKTLRQKQLWVDGFGWIWWLYINIDWIPWLKNDRFSHEKKCDVPGNDGRFSIASTA